MSKCLICYNNLQNLTWRIGTIPLETLHPQNAGRRLSMRAAAVAAIVGLLTFGAAGVPAFDAQPAAAQSGFVLTEGHIAQAKAALHLTPSQERHWPAVAAAMRGVIRAQARDESSESEGMVSRIRSRAASISATTSSIRRLIAAARPLIRSLDAEQRQNAQAMARSMGFTQLASVL
jgi:hypothetical protein